MNAAVAGYAVAALAYGALCVLLLVSRQRTRHGAVALFATAATCAWALATLLGASHGGRVAGGPSGDTAVMALDTVRLLAWTLLPLLLARARVPRVRPAAARRDRRGGRAGDVDPSREPRSAAPRDRRGLGLLGLGVAALALQVVLATRSGTAQGGAADGLAALVRGQLLPLVWLAIALYALTLLEHVYRVADPARRRGVTLLCVSLGAMFAFDLFAFTDALLLHRMNAELLATRGYVTAALAVPVAMALASAPERGMRLHVSRGAAAGSVVLLAAGAWLLLVAAAGYAVRLTGREGEGTLRLVLTAIGAGAVVATFASRRLRGRLRVFLSKHLFSYKYDYRAEWLGFTRTLAEDDGDTPAAICRALTAIVESDAGTLWGRTGDGRAAEPFAVLAQRGSSGHERLDPRELASLEGFLERTGWLVDLDEYRARPGRYEGLTLPAAFVGSPSAWLLVPLPHGESVIGFALIGRSALMKRIDWEDRDLLKTAGHQAAGQLALHLSDAALAEARQFEAFNKASTYIVHDLKNILGQQSLIVANAARHRTNPDFVDDVIETVENSVARMRGLLDQIQGRDVGGTTAEIDLIELLDRVVAGAGGRVPVPTLHVAPTVRDRGVTVRADPERLARVVGHLVQNAQEACGHGGRVSVALELEPGGALVRVEDDGCGMDPAFVREELFRPFRSTKGLTGMGVGAHEAREYARALGGRLDVSSAPGDGSTFILGLPLSSQTTVASGEDGDAPA